MPEVQDWFLTAFERIEVTPVDAQGQDRYRYRSPLSLPRGTRLSMRFTFDNSDANPANRFDE